MNCSNDAPIEECRHRRERVSLEWGAMVREGGTAKLEYVIGSFFFLDSFSFVVFVLFFFFCLRRNSTLHSSRARRSLRRSCQMFLCARGARRARWECLLMSDATFLGAPRPLCSKHARRFKHRCFIVFERIKNETLCICLTHFDYELHFSLY